ncbi:MAG: hypothetical protein ACYDDA_14660, partial [Acidiferrobacteraceae bacterium]
MNAAARYAIWMTGLGVVGTGVGYLLRNDERRSVITGGTIGGLVTGLLGGAIVAYSTAPSAESSTIGAGKHSSTLGPKGEPLGAAE